MPAIALADTAHSRGPLSAPFAGLLLVHGHTPAWQGAAKCQKKPGLPHAMHFQSISWAQFGLLPLQSAYGSPKARSFFRALYSCALFGLLLVPSAMSRFQAHTPACSCCLANLPVGRAGAVHEEVPGISRGFEIQQTGLWIRVILRGSQNQFWGQGGPRGNSSR